MICCFEGSALQGPFSHLLLIDHNNIFMDYARVNALYNGSLRIKISYFHPEESNSYKWCGTKVAHCKGAAHLHDNRTADQRFLFSLHR